MLNKAREWVSGKSWDWFLGIWDWRTAETSTIWDW